MFSSLSHLLPSASTVRPWSWAIVLASGLLSAPAFAQTPTDTAPLSPAESSGKLQRIVVEDAGTRVEEARVGGVTRQIEVQPKTGAPAYQIQPTTVQGPATPASERTGQPGGAGRSSWRVLSF